MLHLFLRTKICIRVLEMYEADSFDFGIAIAEMWLDA